MAKKQRSSARWRDGTPKSFMLRIRIPRPGIRQFGRKGMLGVRSGMSLTDFVKLLLELNDYLPPHKRLTDPQLAEQLATEFPDSISVKRIISGEKTLGYLRSIYNQGKFHPDRKPPPIKSIPYGPKGWPINPWSGKPLSEARASKFMDKHGRRLITLNKYEAAALRQARIAEAEQMRRDALKAVRQGQSSVIEVH